jgi:hypothetical protein
MLKLKLILDLRTEKKIGNNLAQYLNRQEVQMRRRPIIIIQS